jgi:magnesium-transporting ATPase (P-type)
VRDTGKIVLAIGDGGNDVSMIQEADIGVGLSAGKEGRQAALAADFSFAKFATLKRLLFVHGRYNFLRLAYIAHFCVYKSLLLAMMQLFYAFVSAYSGQSVECCFQRLNKFCTLLTPHLSALHVCSTSVVQYCLHISSNCVSLFG